MAKRSSITNRDEATCWRGGIPPPPGREPSVRRPRTTPGSRLLRLPIPVCEPVLRGNERRYVARCVRSGWISSAGPMVREFEAAFARRIGAADAVACSSGTAALHLALIGLGIGPGDEVIIPAFTMVAVCNAVLYAGAKPVLVDVDPRTWTMDADQVARRVTRRTKAIMAVHTYGQPARMDVLARLARDRGLLLLEDAAEALGGSYRGRAVGTWGRAAAFSLYANKVITTGEGGMVAVPSRALGAKLRTLRDHGFGSDRHFWHRVLGYNYRMTSMQAAVGLAQLERFDVLLEARRRNARLYRAALAGVPGLVLPAEILRAKSADWVFGFVAGPAYGRTRDALREILARRGIETRAFFTPLHLQPVHRRLFRGERYRVAEALGARGLYLPSSSSLTAARISYAAECVRAAALPRGER
ncbi:MAG: DegT/DnrJ/EryC1/StrS family aminotransferase [Elusimicrobiota bacterium]